MMETGLSYRTIGSTQANYDQVHLNLVGAKLLGRQERLLEHP
jgi:hypothetical protein